MKIGIFDPYLDTLGGGERYMLTIAECLSRGHEVFIFWNNRSIKERAEAKFGLDLRRVQCTHNIFSKEISLSSRLFLTRNYDIIIFLSDGSIPLILSNLVLHFQFPVEWVRSSLKTKIKFLKVKKILCNSLFTKSYIDRKFGVKSAVLYPPVDLNGYQKRIKKENSILHVGRFGTTIEGKNYKKQDVMIEVFKKMATNGLIRWRFILVISTQPEDRERVALLKKKAIGFPIEIVENIGIETLRKYYSTAKIYWHATGFGEDLKKHPERAEHFGIATVEAMARGCVPIVINAGGQREIVQDGENGLLWNSPRELQDKTLWVIRDSPIWQRLSESAKLASKPYSKERFCEELHEILEE